jgi:hypothetical protein
MMSPNIDVPSRRAPGAASSPHPYLPMRSLEAAGDRIWTAWRSPGRFTKNPDMVRLPDGRLLTVYADTDQHWAEGNIRLQLIQSADRGATWSDAGVIIRSDRSKREPHWVTPRISLLSDGRLGVLCDLDDREHCHETQPPGIFVWWSEDLGETWSDPVNTGIHGIEPDRIIELPDGRLSIGAHMNCSDTQKHAECIWRSPDGGQTWGPYVFVGKDPVHMYCEGAFVCLEGGAVVCVMCDNLHNNYPSQVSYSFDNGDTWTVPLDAPFAGDRPFAGQLDDGLLLVTFRNRSGNRATYGWLGHLQDEQGYRITGLHVGAEDLSLSAAEGLRISHVTPGTTQYNLLPPESYLSEVLFEAQVKVSGGQDEVMGGRCGYVQLGHMSVDLSICPGGIYLGKATSPGQWLDRNWPADMTEWRTIRIHHLGGLLRVFLDGQDVMRFRHLQPGFFVPTCFGSPRDAAGTSQWRNVSYLTRNRTEPEHHWIWEARSGRYPDQYELDRLLELHANPSERPDNGYSTWYQFDDDEILVLDYTNRGDPYGQSHIVGCRRGVEDFEQMGRRPPGIYP